MKYKIIKTSNSQINSYEKKNLNNHYKFSFYLIIFTFISRKKIST